MIVAIDAGNTRIKWGVHTGTRWMAQGAMPTAEADSLAGVSAEWRGIDAVVGCNVAGTEVGERITAALSTRWPPPHWLQARAEDCGVKNGYLHPEQLGADRWAALIGARGLLTGDCLVVCAGTATTVDWLGADGVFHGGLILPGVDLMRASLANNTAQLPLADGEYCLEPRTTLDAITSGCLHAQIGAIERMYAVLPDKLGKSCLLTGGAARYIIPHLHISSRLEENLILDGLVRFGASR